MAKLKGRRQSKNVIDKRGYMPSAWEGAHRTGRTTIGNLKKKVMGEAMREHKAVGTAKALGMGDVGKKMTGALARDAVKNYKKRKGKK